MRVMRAMKEVEGKANDVGISWSPCDLHSSQAADLLLCTTTLDLLV